MEKGVEETGMLKQAKRPKIIVVTGAESTGKSTLALNLADRCQSLCIEEFAREYVEKIGRPYNYSDVEIIARKQIAQMNEALTAAVPFVFFDTWLIITKVWMEVVFHQSPGWVSEAIVRAPVDLFLVCDTDIPWEPDPVRENGGEMRDKLSALYMENIREFGFKFRLISGTGPERLANALKIIADI